MVEVMMIPLKHQVRALVHVGDNSFVQKITAFLVIGLEVFLIASVAMIPLVPC